MAIVLAKVYAAFSPAGAEALRSVEQAGARALGHEEQWLFLEGDLLRISWEGVYFPLEEALCALGDSLPLTAEGRLDYLDIEAWTLTRFIFTVDSQAGKGVFSSSTRSLNQVLEYAGH